MRGGFPITLLLILPRCFISSAPGRLLQRRLHCLSCFILRVRYPSLSTSELSPLIFQWNVAGAPLFFSLGCGHAVLAASWMNGTWPVSSQPLRLFFPFIPPLLLSPPFSPSVMEKQFRFSRFTEKEQEQLQHPISAFPILHSMEIPLWGNGVSDWLQLLLP